MSERKLEKIVELDASPEQVWAAIATGPGITAWFVPTSVEPRADGTITQDFGGGAVASGRISAYEPVSRFRFGAAEEQPPGMPNYAFEFLVEGRDGGGAVLRFVQSGFDDDNPGWENEYNAHDRGWDLFFGNLRAYLVHFPGQPAQGTSSMVFAPVTPAEAWQTLRRALHLGAARPAEGEQITLEGPQRISGVVDVSSELFLGVRSASGLHRITAEGEAGCGVAVLHYFYGEPVDAEKLAEVWQSWLAELFPQPAGAGGGAG